jgi:putative two-component system response regulator
MTPAAYTSGWPGGSLNEYPYIRIQKYAVGNADGIAVERHDQGLTSEGRGLKRQGNAVSGFANTNARVLLVGQSDAAGCATEMLSSQPWTLTVAQSAHEAMHRIRDEGGVDMVLLLPGPVLDPSTELCRTIKFDRRLSHVPVIVMLPAEHLARSHEVLEAGADDCISHTAAAREVILRLQRVIRAKQATDSLEDATTVITALANAIEGKDRYTCGHVERVAAYSVEMGRRLGVDAEDLIALRTGGVVHDIGKVGVPDPILNKPGKLTEEEMAIMRRHPVIGHDILKPLRTFRAVLPIVRWHHEKPNGKGYPDGLAGEQLPLLPRITAVADVFDAVATDRPYRPAFPIPKCRDILLQSADCGDLDMAMVRLLLEILEGGAQTMAA